ncbi:LysR family transcriptional regulator [Ideonella livida]|uniref:LysR family transcriptional regulator n=1 Tax=Ideonella livida TaxID=2707176 RepID=A0A7C9PIL2_9BURK|nr:LysR family transcriptional regulator [Ideonella livida]NDY92609.1 LysR family transcriptional regulator [Ideonella livida]
MSRPLHRPLSLDFLRSFAAVARHLSFSLAAEELHLTQPAVSRQIRSLEEDLGTPLFVRGTRRIDLTSAGHTLLHTVQPLLARLDSSVRHIRMSQGRQQVHLTTFASFSSLWLMPRLTAFEAQHPRVDLRLSATDELLDDRDPEIDLALRHCTAARAQPGAIRLFGEVLSPLIGARLAGAIAAGDAPPLRSPADLAHHTLIEMDDRMAHSVDLGWPHWLQSHNLLDLVPRRWLSMNYTHQQIQAAQAGQGVALARLPLVHDALRRGELVEPFGPAGRLHAPTAYWLVPLQHGGATGQAAPRAEVGAFCDWVLAQAAETRCALGEGPDTDELAHCD